MEEELSRQKNERTPKGLLSDTTWISRKVIDRKGALANSDELVIILSPSRYFELVQIHGKLDPLVNVDLRPEKRVKITFTCGSNSEVKSVDIYRTVSDLKSRLEAFAGFPASKMRLFYVDQDLRDIQV